MDAFRHLLLPLFLHHSVQCIIISPQNLKLTLRVIMFVSIDLFIRRRHLAKADTFLCLFVLLLAAPADRLPPEHVGRLSCGEDCQRHIVFRTKLIDCHHNLLAHSPVKDHECKCVNLTCPMMSLKENT